MNKWIRMLAAALVTTLLLQLLPLSLFAERPAEQFGVGTPEDGMNQYLQSLSEAPDASHELPDAESSAKDAVEAFVAGEFAERRGETEKHFRMSDGSCIAVDYGAPVHYTTDGETWQDIDNTLQFREAAKEDEGAAQYVAENGEHSSSFAAALDGGALFSLSSRDAALHISLEPAEYPEGQSYDPQVKAEVSNPEKLPDSMKGLPLAEQVRPERIESEVLYRDVWPDVDLHYTLSSFNVKESIVVKTPREACGFTFRLTLDGLTPALQEDGSIELRDAAGEAAYLIPAPYMTDADGAYSDAVSYTLTQQEEAWLLTVAADADWINAPDRAFPVEIDPTVIDETSSSAFTGKWVGSSLTANTTNLICGYHPTYGMTEVYFKLTSFPTLPAGNELVFASVGLLQNDYRPQSYTGEMTLSLSACQEEANYSTLNWSTRPAVGEKLDYCKAKYSTVNSYLFWDITREAKRWYQEDVVGQTTNLGLALTSDATAANGRRAWLAKTTYFIIGYRSVEGVESYYSYQTLGAGRAGTAYISDNTGYLTIATPLAGLASTVNPFTLSLVYNSSYFAKDPSNYDVAANLGFTNMHFGSGMKLNVVQKMETTVLQYESGGSNTKTYLKYTDGDGGAHYFATDASRDPTLQTYYDEDGLQLEAVIDNAGTNRFTITDQKDNRMVFVQNYLYKLIDRNGNEIKIVYNTGNGEPAASARISSVVQTNYGQSAVTIASFTYAVHNGVSGHLYQVTDYAGNVYRLNYGGGKLRKIYRTGAGENAETEIIEYYQEYENNTYHNPITGLLDKVSGYGLWFTYDHGDHGRIDGYYEAVGNTRGAQVSISRQLGEKTVYHDWGIDRALGGGDDLYTTCLFDSWGHSVNCYTTDEAGRIIGATNAVYNGSGSSDRTNNRLLQTAGIGNPGMSVIKNGSFEATGANYLWTLDTGGIATTLANAVTNTEKHMTGEKALKLYLSPDAPAGTVVGAHRTTYNLEANKTYTVSAYVNTTQAYYASGSQGVNLKVTKTGYNDAVGKKLNYKTDAQINGGWVRIELSFTTASAGAYTVWICNDGMHGVVYVDDVQLEQNEAASNRNLLENGGLHLQSDWAFTSATTNDKLISGQAPEIPGCGGYVIQLVGDPAAGKTACQRVTVNQPGSQSYVLSGWAKANAVPDNLTVATGDDAEARDGYKQFGLRAVLTYTDSTTEYHYAAFNPDVTDWQFASLTVVPKQPTKTVRYIDVVCTYERNANTAWFAGLSLVKELAQTMRYDAEGNLISVESTDVGADTATYSGGDLIHAATAASGSYDYTYDSRHNLSTATNGVVTQENTVNGAGNTTAAECRSNNSSYLKQIHTSASYGYNQNLLLSETDSRGGVTGYRYKDDEGTELPLYQMIGKPYSTTDAKGTNLYTLYLNDGRTNMRYVSGVVSEQRTYDSTTHRLSSITRGGYIPGVSGKQSQTYSFTYDAFGNVTQIKVGDLTLANYVYGSHNGPLQSVSYGNNASVSYTYDALGRTTQTQTSSGDSYGYRYNGDGQLYEMTDTAGGLTYRYSYDGIGRLMGSELRGETDVLLQTWQEYDEAGRAASQAWRLTEGVFREGYTYDTHGRLTQKALTLPNSTNANQTFTYDGLSRLSSASSPVSVDYYNYTAGTGTNGTTGLVSAMSHNAVSGSSLSYMYMSYQYDALGNVTQETQTGQGTTSYTYDAQNQLTQASRGSGSYIWNYTYDTYGNLRSWDYRVADQPQESATYTYGNTDWLDLLTGVSLNGGTTQPIVYEGQSLSGGTVSGTPTSGNPISWYDGTRWTLTWRNGRELATASKSGVSLSFEYDANGLRTGKTRSATNKHAYVYAGGKLLRDKYTYAASYIYYMDFVYDASGRPYALYLTVDGQSSVYYYLLNAQGDVVRLVGADGATVANYTYDPYGRLLGVTNASGAAITSGTHVANLNPLRYRGYYYDTETGWYYLQSRYYDPIIKRFLNADSYASTGQGFLGYNMFAYCGNNPVIAYDPSGSRSIIEEPGHNCGGDVIGYTDTGTGRYVSYTPPEYFASELDPSGFNCYAYILGINVWVNVGDISGYKPLSNNVYEVAKSVESDIKALGWSIRSIEHYGDELNEGEYLIALRTGISDYHFMICFDGVWMQKNGEMPITYAGEGDPSKFDWNKPAYVFTRETAGLFETLVLGYYKNYYDSPTILFAITPIDG